MSVFASLEIQIISINVISLIGSIWSWFKWDQQLEKISNFSVSDNLDVKNIDWLKTVLSWIVLIRFIINRVSLLAYIVNICTVATRRWQNLLIFWMVLSLLRDVVLEIIVIIIAFLQWHKGSVSTWLFVGFVTEKIFWLAISICKWRTVLKWYMRLRREMKIRMFVKIARRSIANLVNIPGRIGHSLDDECLDIATIRRHKYANLMKLSEKSSNKINFGLRISKSLTTLVTDDSHDSHDTNGFNANDLSVAEKSMRLLGITAEDVMDACARIQERSYWSAQDEITKTPEAMEEAGAIQVSLERDEEETDDVSGKEKKDKEENMKKPVDRILEKKDVARDSQIEKDERKDEREVNDVSRSKQTAIDIEKAMDYNLMEEVIIRSFQIETEWEEEDNKIDKKEQTLIEKEQNGSLTKSEDITSDRLDNRVKSTESHKNQEDVSSRRRKREEEAERLAKICPLSSVQCKNARNMEVKPCSSLVRKLETKLRPISTNQKEKWFDQLDRRNSYRMKLTPNGSDKKEHKNSRTSLCACHRALKRNTEKRKPDRSTDINDVKHDRKEFRHFMSIINAQKDKMNECGSAFKYSEAYRLKKQIQKAEGSSTKQTVAWGSMSLAQTARPSGYARDAVATNKSPGICQRNVQSEACAESIDSRSIYNASLTEKNYARSEKRETKCPEANDLTLNKRGVKARRRQDLSPNRKLSSEDREAIELKALRAFNELTLLEDKKKLEAKRNRDSLNYEQPTGSEVDTIIRGHDFSSRKRPMEDSSSLKVSKYTSEDKKELKAEEKSDSSKDETSKENVEGSRSVSDHPSEGNREEIGILSSETRRENANSSLQINERYTGQAYTSLNLREITRNIEWSVHPRGIVLTNKNLHRQFSENEGRESQQRDIIDDNVASTLHSAFFFKPEIVTRVFRRAQMRIGESLPSFPTFWHEDSNIEFVCQVNNEMAIQGNRNSSSFDLDLEQIADRTNLGNLSFPDANNNRVVGEENRDLCIIFIDQEQASHESETASIENSIVRSQEENARSSVENIEATNILLVCILRDFGLEMSEESVHDVIENTEEYGDISNVIANFQPSNETSPEEEGDNNRDSTISSHQQTLIPNDSCPDGVTSPVNLLQRDNSYNLPDKRHTSGIDISSEKRTHENNLFLKDVNNNAESQASNSNNNNQFDMFVNKSEKSVFNQILENASQLSSSGSPSFIKEDNFNQSMLSSINKEELQRLTQVSASEATLTNQGTESIMNLETTNRDMISQFETFETLDSLEMIQNDVKNEDENRNIYEKANIFLTHRFSGINQNERLQQDNSFYSLYERNHDGTKTISFGDGSLMEEFSNSTIPSSNASARNFQ